MRLSSEDHGHGSVNNKKKIHKILQYELKLNKYYIWQIMRFDEFFITSILLGLKIEELYYTITTPRGSIPSILLNYHYILLDITDGLWDQQNLFW